MTTPTAALFYLNFIHRKLSPQGEWEAYQEWLRVGELLSDRHGSRVYTVAPVLEFDDRGFPIEPAGSAFEVAPPSGGGADGGESRSTSI